MRLSGRNWLGTVLAAALSGAVWVVAASKGYALEMIWLPAVAVGAAWPRRRTQRRCFGWRRAEEDGAR
jgi:hypothetical protein